LIYRGIHGIALKVSLDNIVVDRVLQVAESIASCNVDPVCFIVLQNVLMDAVFIVSV
jgi:hypothetical protein